MGYDAPLAEIKVSVFTEIVLLRDLVKDRAVAVKESLRSVNAFAAHDAFWLIVHAALTPFPQFRHKKANTSENPSIWLTLPQCGHVASTDGILITTRCTS